MKITEIEKENILYPSRLKELKDSPDKIYAIGNIELLNNKKTLAIVGSRECSVYGKEIASRFAQNLSKAGICIVSGLASGIDTSAHIRSCWKYR